jgi:hypothetical protein
MLGTSPAVVVYPKNWNSTVVSSFQDSNKKVFRSVFSSVAAVSSGAFAAGCLGMCICIYIYIYIYIYMYIICMYAYTNINAYIYKCKYEYV